MLLAPVRLTGHAQAANTKTLATSTASRASKSSALAAIHEDEDTLSDHGSVGASCRVSSIGGEEGVVDIQDFDGDEAVAHPAAMVADDAKHRMKAACTRCKKPGPTFPATAWFAKCWGPFGPPAAPPSKIGQESLIECFLGIQK